MGTSNINEQQNQNRIIEIDFLKKYIYYAKKKLSPILNNVISIKYFT